MVLRVDITVGVAIFCVQCNAEMLQREPNSDKMECPKCGFKIRAVANMPPPPAFQPSDNLRRTPRFQPRSLT